MISFSTIPLLPQSGAHTNVFGPFWMATTFEPQTRRPHFGHFTKGGHGLYLQQAHCQPARSSSFALRVLHSSLPSPSLDFDLIPRRHANPSAFGARAAGPSIDRMRNFPDSASRANKTENLELSLAQ